MKTGKPDPRLSIYLVAYFKRHDKGPEFGFERVHFRYFFRDLKEARESAKYFCDEAGYYDGMLIEERKEGFSFYHGTRIFYLQDQKTGDMIEMPEPEWFKDVVNLI